MILEKLDLTKAYPEYYKATSKPKMVNIEPLNYLSVKGKSSPEDQKFTSAIEELYAMAYTIKFNCKVHDLDFVVPKMEGFWWVEGDLTFDQTPREEWCWKIVMRMPDFVGDVEYSLACESLRAKNKAHARVQIEEIHEGLSAQILHVGSYEEEAATLEKLYTYIEQEGFKINGHHHEIYLSDPLKTAPHKLKTILRYAIM